MEIENMNLQQAEVEQTHAIKPENQTDDNKAELKKMAEVQDEIIKTNWQQEDIIDRDEYPIFDLNQILLNDIIEEIENTEMMIKSQSKIEENNSEKLLEKEEIERNEEIEEINSQESISTLGSCIFSENGSLIESINDPINLTMNYRQSNNITPPMINFELSYDQEKEELVEIPEKELQTGIEVMTEEVSTGNSVENVDIETNSIQKENEIDEQEQEIHDNMKNIKTEEKLQDSDLEKSEEQITEEIEKLLEKHKWMNEFTFEIGTKPSEKLAVYEARIEQEERFMKSIEEHSETAKGYELTDCYQEDDSIEIPSTKKINKKKNQEWENIWGKIPIQGSKKLDTQEKEIKQYKLILQKISETQDEPLRVMLEANLRIKCGLCMRTNHKDERCWKYIAIPRTGKAPDCILKQDKILGSHCSNHEQKVFDDHWSCLCPEFRVIRNPYRNYYIKENKKKKRKEITKEIAQEVQTLGTEM